MTQVHPTTTNSIEAQVLARAMAHLHRVVERRNTIPILANVRLSPGGQYLTLTATDLDIEARIDVDCETSGTTEITVPAATLHDISRKIAPGAAASMSWEPGATSITARAGRSRFTLHALPATDFPDIATGEMTHTFTLAATTLLELVKATSFAISTEETRYYLNGIYLHTVLDDGEEANLRAVATDGHRLAMCDAPAPAGAAGMPGIIIPRKTVGEMAKIAESTMDKKGQGNIEVALSTHKIRISAPGITLTSKLIDGTFPDYQRVIPRQNDTPAVIERATFAHAAERVTTISSERGRAVKITLNTGKLNLSVSNPDTGSAEEEIEADYTGGEAIIGFNSRYLADTLGALEGETVLVKLGAPGTPTTFQKSEGDKLLIVLMPMRV